MATDWYRRNTWTKADEEEFFMRLGRARKDGRAQYLKLQAYALMDTEKSSLLTVAESLLTRILSDFPDDRVEKSQTLNALGVIQMRRGTNEAAIQFFQPAIEFEKAFPYSISGAHLNLGVIVVKTGRTDLYDEAQERFLAEANRGGIIFPAELYTIGSVLAIIFAFKDDVENAKYFAEVAANNATAKTNTLWNPRKRHYGTVEHRKVWLDRLVKKAQKFVKRDS